MDAGLRVTPTPPAPGLLLCVFVPQELPSALSEVYWMLQVQGEGDATEQTEKIQSRENTVLFGADGGEMRREGAKPSQSGIPSGDERGKSDQGWVREEAGHLATATDGAGRERRWLAAGCVTEG